jgi:MtfA peptidase
MNYNRLRFRILFIAAGLALLFFFYTNMMAPMIVASSVLVLALAIRMFPESNSSTEFDEEWDQVEPQADPNIHSFYGDDLDFSEEEISGVLNKHSRYFNKLTEEQKKRFISRLADFLESKAFNFHKGTPYRVMPILISSSAIQFSLGLENYLLPHFETINIYPSEYFFVKEDIHFIEGNVTGTDINISWKNFVDGYKMPDDGQNVGLHEMAHAYYYQNFGPCAHKDEQFIYAFEHFELCGKTVFEQISNGGLGIYPEYGKKNFQEFWAVTIELFFERPSELKTFHSDLYTCLTTLLKQDPTSVAMVV